MSIHESKKGIIGVGIGRNIMSCMYEGLHLVWRAVRSCYGTGKWIPERPWLDNDIWKDS